MRWLVGVDLNNSGAGAVELARWLHGRAPAETFTGAHVVDFDVRELFARVQDDETDDAVPPYVDELLVPLRDDPAFSEVGSISASAAEDGLTHVAQTKGDDVILIGRRKPMRGSAVFRLGRVARRLLRTLPGPVVVVPPDARLADFSDGPVVLATDMGETSVGAARFAKAVVDRFELDTLVTSVASVPDELSLLTVHERWRAVVDETFEAVRTRLAQWVQAHGLSDARSSVVEGHVGPALLEVAKVAGASMIVVGSRGLSTFDRIMLSSVGTELAASAPIPVVVVPPDWPASPSSKD